MFIHSKSLGEAALRDALLKEIFFPAVGNTIPVQIMGVKIRKAV
jgi:hypothetical protein